MGVEMCDQCGDDALPKSGFARPVIADRRTDPVIGNDQVPVLSLDMISHRDSTISIGDESVLEGIDHQFGDDEPQTHGNFRWHHARIRIDLDRDTRGIRDHRFRQTRAESMEIGGNFDIVVFMWQLELLLVVSRRWWKFEGGVISG